MGKSMSADWNGFRWTLILRSERCAMTTTQLDEALYRRYILPTQRPRKRYVGVELEYPVVNLSGAAVNFQIVHHLTDLFVTQFAFDELHRDDEGEIYSAVSSLTGDCLSYDCSYNTLELSFGKEENIHVLNRRFRRYYTFIQQQLLRFGHMLTGMGINPNYRQNHNAPVPNGRYRMLLNHLSSYEKYGDILPFHDHPNFGLFACASQVQLDVEEEQIPQTLQVFGKLEPFKTLLFANSLFREDGGWILARDHFWRDSMHGYNPQNVDYYPDSIKRTEDLIRYLRTMSIFCTERDGHYVNFTPMPAEAYFSADSVVGEYNEDGVRRELCFRPRLEDLPHLRSYKLEDLTYRGTIEYRSICQQPVSQVFAPAAFHAGLAEQIPALDEFLSRDASLFGHGLDAGRLRDLLNRGVYPDYMDAEQVSTALIGILDLAWSGLRARGFGEECFLEPLYVRAERLLSPALELADGLSRGLPMYHFIKRFADPDAKILLPQEESLFSNVRCSRF